MEKPYAIQDPEGGIKAFWSERISTVDPCAVYVMGPCPPFAFGQVFAACPNRTVAEQIVAALNLQHGLKKLIT